MTIYADKKNGKSTGRYCVEITSKGKRYSKRVDTLKEAEKLEAEWRLALRASQKPVQAKARSDGLGVPKTLEALVRRSEGLLWRGQATERLNYLRLAKALKLLGDMPIDAFDTLVADRLTDLLEDSAPATRNRFYSAINSLLKFAMKRGWRVASLPEFAWERESASRIREISPHEEALMSSILATQGRSDIADLVKVAIATGMRRSEILCLQEAEIEPEWVRLWKTKTNHPRSVPITLETAKTLRKLVRDGMPTVETLRYWWDKAKVEMGLRDDKHFVFHACRHTCATRMVRADVHLFKIQRFLGHTRIETTMRYAHVNDTMLRSVLPQADVGLAGLTRLPMNGDLHEASPRGQRLIKGNDFKAGVAKLVDAQDLGSCGLVPFSGVFPRFNRPSNDN